MFEAPRAVSHTLFSTNAARLLRVTSSNYASDKYWADHAAVERNGDTSQDCNDFSLENGSSQGQNLALTV